MNSRSPEADTEAPIWANLRAMMKLLAFLVVRPAADRRTWEIPNSV